MAIQTVTQRQPMAQRPVTQAFTPQIPQSRIIQALLAQGASQTPVRTPIEGVGRLAQTLTGALLEKKEAKRAQEQQQASIAGLGDLAGILAGEGTQLPQGVQGPPMSPGMQAQTQQQQFAQFIRQQQDPALAQQAFDLQQALANRQPEQFTNVQFDAFGNAIGIRGGRVQAVPGAGGAQDFGKQEREAEAEQRAVRTFLSKDEGTPVASALKGSKEDKELMKRAGPEGDLFVGTARLSGGAQDISGLAKKTVGEVEKQIFNTVASGQRLNDIQRNANANFQTFGNQAKQLGLSLTARVSPALLGPDQKQFLESFSDHRQTTARNVNQSLREMSGKAVTKNEFERFKQEAPTAGRRIGEGDDPVTFERKVKKSIDLQRRALMRLSYFRNTGITEDLKEMSEIVSIDNMRSFVDNKGNDIVQELRTQFPDMSEDEIQATARERVRNLFGGF